ncbi:MAG TPA: hypothetical protein VH299_03250 [Solirubrobacterales bacterium]|nr:hypothetical protein [Solirubrobacterales bacterium]
MVDQPTGLGPVQLLIIAFEDGKFEGRILEELRRLRAHDMVRLIDLLFVAKDEDDEVIELEVSDLSVAEIAEWGALVGALIGFGAGGDAGAVDGAQAAAAAAAQNGSLLGSKDAWFLADQIPRGTAAAIVLLEHRWAMPLRDAIEAADGHDLVDTWVHPEDLIAIGAGRDH